MIITPTPNDFGNIALYKRGSQLFTITNDKTEIIEISGITESHSEFISDFTEAEIMPDFNASAAMYFGADGRIHDSDGKFYTTDQGYGTVGSTDGAKLLTITHLTLTAFQITNADDASAPNSLVLCDIIEVGDNIVMSFYTASDKVRIAGVDYSTNIVAPVNYKEIIVSITKNNHSVNWVKQLELVGYVPEKKCLAYHNGYIYAVDMRKTEANYWQSRIFKINPADGTSTELALTPVDTAARAHSVDYYDGFIYAFGYVRSGANNAGNPAIWKVALDLSSQSLVYSGFGSSENYIFNAKFGSDGKLWGSVWGENLIDQISLVNASKSYETAYTNATASKAGISPTRVLATTKNDTEQRFTMRGHDVTTDLYNEIYNATNTTLNLGCCEFDGTNFKAFYNDGAKLIIRTIDDANAYSKIGVDVEITPNSLIAGAALLSYVIADCSTHWIIAGLIKGKMESAFTPSATYVDEATTKWDIYVKLVEK